MKTMSIKQVVFAVSIAFTAGLAVADAECSDGICVLPTGEPNGSFPVLSPIPQSAVQPVEQAPRLKTLEGKAIALVGGSFMASVTHGELKRLILKEFPTAKVYLLSEIGSAGVYPQPGVVRREKDEFQLKLKEFKVDAVISGNGGCGLCTPKEMGSCIAAEVIGIPSVMVAGPGFVDQAQATAHACGVRAARIAEYPGAFASHTREQLERNAREILWPAVKKGLTAPITKAELDAGVEKPAGNGIVMTGTIAEVLRTFEDSGWTDGLPIMPPTEEAVEEFLKFTDLKADHEIGVIPPARRAVTVRHVAVNGVMSGCKPEFMPLLLAFVEAMKVGDFRRTLVSTHAWTPFCWLNGPVARQLGFDGGQGEISEPRNVALGRFINLAMINLGGYRVKLNRMGTFGYLMPFTMVEDDKAAVDVGWKPYHMQQGYDIDESTLSCASAINWGNNLVPASSDPETIKNMIAWDAVEKQQMAVGSGMPRVYRTFLLTPDVVKELAKAYKSNDALEAALIKTARTPLAMRAYANYYGNPGSAFDPATCPLSAQEKILGETEMAEETETPPWLAWTGKKTCVTVPVMQDGKNVFLVTGDPARNKEQCVPGGASVCVKIELPKAWDKLMTEKGYEPLSNFKLKSDLRPDIPKPRVRGYDRPGVRADRGNQIGRPRPGMGQGGMMRRPRPGQGQGGRRRRQGER